ncbi:MAG: helix-turn-helix transcriptional regulator [Prolixibacteraceae bacterium]|jgi:DNA-binding XRE family transcriptional regulator|nr:helix-turn-helix transcriptional regulator [Prolixibacteraceae bacterium]
MKKKVDPRLTEDVDQILKEIGSRIKSHRKQIANNYEDFARTHNFNKVTLSRIESGENSSLKSIIILARKVGIQIEDLFKGIQ